MKNSDSHVFLYAKGHYKETDVKEDLEKIYCKRCGLPRLSAGNIIQCLVNLIEKYPKYFRLFDFLNDIRPENTWMVGYHWKRNKKEYNYEKAIMYKCLSILSMLEISEIGELDEADPNILPLAGEL